jgi:type VI secretion system protein ImpF
MAELTSSERLQPSLLDRLTDDAPDQAVESRDKRVLSVQRLREFVLRDLQWLLNCGNLEQTIDLEAYPLVRSSVLNYGVPDLSGATLSGANLADLERQLRDAIWNFEPRLLRHSLRVRAQASPDESHHNALMFEIEGELWAQPLPVRLFMRTELDLDTGEVSVSDVNR